MRNLPKPTGLSPVAVLGKYQNSLALCMLSQTSVAHSAESAVGFTCSIFFCEANRAVECLLCFTHTYSKELQSVSFFFFFCKAKAGGILKKEIFCHFSATYSMGKVNEAKKMYIFRSFLI